MKTATIPELALVVLIGPSGSGKSSFARKHFRPTEVLSSDYCRGLVSDDENALAATRDAFEVLHFIAAKRLKAGRLTVIDATNVQPEARKPLVALAREYHCLPVAIVLNLPERICQDRNKDRPDRSFGPHVIRHQSDQLRRSLRGLEREGFRHTFILNTPGDVDGFTFERQKLWNDLREEHGPFDIIGDIHGCFTEMRELLGTLGYDVRDVGESNVGRRFQTAAPSGRKAVLLGDLVDRGPDTAAVLRLAMDMVADGTALCVPGNHDMKLMKKLKGRDIQIAHGLAESLEQLDRETPGFTEEVVTFLDDLVSHYVLDDGKLVVAHAGMKESMQGRGSGRVRDFALYGETTGETDEYGLPVRWNWAAGYRGQATVVYGHTPVSRPEWLNNTICIDTGCVFGGTLTALRYPERELVSVPAACEYYEPARPLLTPPAEPDALTAQQSFDDLLLIEDVTGKRIVETRLVRTVTIREENSIAALEVMSRFAANPKWLTYLPPTMSPSETTAEPGLLEHPAEAFSYFRKEGVARVVCQEKHMGSRAVLVVCRDEETVRKRFGIVSEGIGICHTRTGRRFFEDAALETEFLATVKRSLDRANAWEEFKTDWVSLDCELMPWSAKAQELLQDQYAAVGVAARVGLGETVNALRQASGWNQDVGPLLARFEERATLADAYVRAYRQYCWPVRSLSDLKLAPFHLLATEGAVHADKSHVWHMETLSKICRTTPELLIETPFTVIELGNADSEHAGIAWWLDLTGKGGEGMVVKPFDFVTRCRGRMVQPAIKCRGPEYLRIIYGPEYTEPQNLARLRARGLSMKRSLALREFALGIEGLERFVRREPLRRVHECVFGVLALESEPVDPRL
jgi:protein phosphatase